MKMGQGGHKKRRGDANDGARGGEREERREKSAGAAKGSCIKTNRFLVQMCNNSKSGHMSKFQPSGKPKKNRCEGACRFGRKLKTKIVLWTMAEAAKRPKKLQKVLE